MRQAEEDIFGALTGRKEAKQAIQTPPRRDILYSRNSGAAVGNGGNHDKTDHPKHTRYRPLRKAQ